MSAQSRDEGTGHTAKVFISSTVEDLQDYRSAARDGALRLGLVPVMQEYWPGKDNPPLAECRQRVTESDVLIVIVAHRYGWVPPDQDGDDDKSITWLECEWGIVEDKKILAFILDESVDWPEERKDGYDLSVAMEAGTATTEGFAETQRRIQRLKELKAWFNTRGIRETFVSPEDLRGKVESALNGWLRQLRAPGEESPRYESLSTRLEWPVGYLDWLRRECQSVELLGLDAREANAVRLTQVYVPAVTSAAEGDAKRASSSPREERESEPMLLQRLDRESLYIHGPPGSGKSTFCRWVSLIAAGGTMPSHPIDAPEAYRERFPSAFNGRLPVLVPLREFWPNMEPNVGVRSWTRTELEAALGRWLDGKRPGGLTGTTLLGFLGAGNVLLILDGLDEVPPDHGADRSTTYPREVLLAGLADSVPVWAKKDNRIVLTSRPYGLDAAGVGKLKLNQAPLAPLPGELQRLFIRRWFAAVDPDRQELKAEGLIGHLAGRGDLGVLTENPLLLTALCIRWGEGQRLPEDQYHLYDSIVNTVLYSRYPGGERERSPVRDRLAAVAWGMHSGNAAGTARRAPEAEVDVAEVDRILQRFAQANPATEHGMSGATAKREDLLSRSGLLLPRPNGRAAFYHLSFQEFLAADYLARSGDDDGLLDIFRARGIVAEWRPTLVYLFAALAFRHRSAQWAVERLTKLAGELERRNVHATPAPAVLVADCLEIALAKQYHLDELIEGFRQVCLDAIEDEVNLPDRQRLGVVLGQIGDPRVLDPRDRRGYVEIPAGRYPYQEGEVFEVASPYWLSRYPVTNSQFEPFIQEGGYDGDDSLWLPQGREWLQRENVTEPRYWHDRRWSGPNQPVVGVSFWEAEAFCRWAGGRLPTEREWEAAARGAQGHAYPWGDDWQDGICNTSESGLRTTSPVGLFPRSRQVDFGLEDMAGNVWEWCTDKVEELNVDTGRLRGGSWYVGSRLARSAFRGNLQPENRFNDFGFRVLLSV